jgi:hypothetical protein
MHRLTLCYAFKQFAVVFKDLFNKPLQFLIAQSLKKS